MSNDISLITNRRPARQFAETLVRSFVNWGQVPSETKSQLIDELGPEPEVTPFISQLKFEHGKSDFPLLQERLRSRFVSRYGDDLAWGNFKSETLEWLVLRGRKRISLEDVRRIAAKTRPRPLREDFEVPPGYSVPDESFHRNLLRRVTSSKGAGFVLEGSPGRGKSIYLSFLCGELTQREIPYIRHHYFLPIEHSNPRRLFMDEVANTLIHQIEERYPQYRPNAQPTAEHLREWISSCATRYSNDGKPFVVIIDGLDHVWRENGRDIAPLEALLAQLLPLPPNLVLLLGTQPLNDENLPPTLRQARPEIFWVPMPGMSIGAIASWLSKQIEANRFFTPRAQGNLQEYVDEVAEALFQVSSGHPLHVIYSLEMLLNSGVSVTPYSIDKLPPCPEGDIRRYYDDLWLRLSYVAKDVLHLISEFEFLWSRDAILEVLGDNTETATALSSVRHLTYATPLGLKPFHSSLGAHVREHSEHDERVQRLLPKVIQWLSDRAPDYLKWGWLWLTQAKAGDIQALVDGPSWDWALDALTVGYSPSQMVRIGEEAEKLAFRKGDFARAVELRWLKTRLLNGPDFQTNDFSRLTALTLELSESTVMAEEILQDLGGVATRNLRVFGEYLLKQGRVQDAQRCLNEVTSRFNRKVGLKLRISHSERETEATLVVSLLGACGTYDPGHLMTWINRSKFNPEKLFVELLLAICRQGDLKRLLALVDQLKTNRMQQVLELEAIRLACRLGVDLSGWPEFQQFRFHPLSACWALTHRISDHSLPVHEIPEELLADSYFSTESEKVLEDWLLWHFFWCLAKSFTDVAPVLPNVELPKVPWIATALPVLQEAAGFAGQRLRRGDAVGFSHIWRFLHRLVTGKGYEDRSVELCLRRAMLRVAIDLGLLNSSRYGSVPVSKSDIDIAIDSGHFHMGQLITRGLRRAERLLTTEDAIDYVSCELDNLAVTVTPFNERVEQYFDLAEFAQLYGLRSLTERSAKGAARCILGYGAHKDYWIFRVIEAIAICGKSKLPQCDGWARRIAPAVEQISEFTDGDDVHYAREQFGKVLLDINPVRYTAYYQSLIRRAEWKLAEDVLELHMKKARPSKPFQALLGTVFEGTILKTLLGQEAAPVEYVARAQMAHLGQNKPHTHEGRSSPDNFTELEFDAASYPPDKFTEFRELINGTNRFQYDSKPVSLWFEYWVGRQPREVLKLMEEEFAKNDVGYAFSDIPDRLFETAIRLQGKEKAFHWLVLGHIHNHGWSSEYSSGTEYRRRFEHVAKYYAVKWKEFINETSLPFRKKTRSEDALIIGNSRLVEFLLIVDQPEPAAAITETLVSCFEREVIEQPLPRVDWLN